MKHSFPPSGPGAARSNRRLGAMPTVSRWLCAGLVGMASCGAALADSYVYRYTGRPFTDVRCFSAACPVTTDDHLSMTMEVAQPIPPETGCRINPPDSNSCGVLPDRLTLSVGTVTVPFFWPDVETLADVATDAAGNITIWRFIARSDFRNRAPYALVQVMGGVGSATGLDRVILRTPPVDVLSDAPGTWALETSIDPGFSYGSITRSLSHGPLDQSRDKLMGGAGVAATAGVTTSALSGTQAARGAATTAGPVAGAWASAMNGWGAARGVAFRSYRNDTAAPLTFKVNAVLEGGFLPAPDRLVSGPVMAGGAMHIFDSTAFAARLREAGGDGGQLLLGGWQPVSNESPLAGFTQLRGLFQTGLLGSGETVLSAGAAPASAPVASGFVTVGPRQQFTVMVDAITNAVSSATAGRSDSGVANFLNTLKPASVQFTGLAGEPAAGIVSADGAPNTQQTPTDLALSLSPTQHPAGSTASVAATVTGTMDTVGGSTPGTLPNVPVEFYVTSGPDVGKTGVAVSDANGVATFDYVGDNDVGKDVVQARIGTLASTNTVEHTWTPARCPHPQSFWATHPGLWSTASLVIGRKSYAQAALLPLLKLVPRNASFALFQQDAVAQLNAAAGGDTSRLALDLLMSEPLLEGFDAANPQQNVVDSATSLRMLGMAARMALYNFGVGPRTCTP